MKLAYSELGSGDETIVILHGLYGSGLNWVSIARRLAVTRRILLLDLPNHGASEWSNCISYEELAQEIENFLKRHKLEKATLLGHSMGGKIAMTVVLTEPELVQQLIIADIAPVRYNHNNLSIISALEALDIGLVRNRKDADIQLKASIPDQKMRGFLLQNLIRLDDGYQWRINIPALKAGMSNIEGFPTFPEKTSCDKPALFLAGDQSDFIGQSSYHEINRLFPNSRVTSLANAGHWLHTDNPSGFLDHVEKFLDR